MSSPPGIEVMDQDETPGQCQGQAGGRSDAVVAVQCSSQVIDTVAVGIPPGERAKKFCPDAPAIPLRNASPPDEEIDVVSIDILPPEMLRQIFDKLTMNPNNGSDLEQAQQKETILNCRLVSSRWNFEVESVLEKKCLEIWKKLPKDLGEEPPNINTLLVLPTGNRFFADLILYPFRRETYNYPVLPEETIFPLEWGFCPPPLLSQSADRRDEITSNPFASKCLKITSDLGLDPSPYFKMSRGTQLTKIIPLFSSFGHHLSSLIMERVTLSPEILSGILKNVPNLKVFKLTRITFFHLEFCRRPYQLLPSLTHLQHIRLLGAKPLTKETFYWRDFDHQKQIYSWILAPYKKQLLTLDTDVLGGYPSNFSALQRLFVYDVKDLKFLEPNVVFYPNLKCLSLPNIKINTDTTLEMIRDHIAPFSKTLSSLHLNFNAGIYWISSVRGHYYEPLPYSTLKRREKIEFLKMKTFSITFPNLREEVNMVKEFLKGFPKLERLNFVFNLRNYPMDKISELIKVTKALVDGEEYWRDCPELKKFSIKLELNGDGLMRNSFSWEPRKPPGFQDG
ncbi:unnamed protein product [Orchesella dallaii]|uniref:F-box domain-containing protein n=1 Tax=Orchesella dallaii TaxID=48710 RepID=A0ABP1RJX0_9HEXA